MSETQTQRAVASGLTISVPPFTSLVVDCVGIQRPNSKKTSGGFACPKCHGEVKQRYVCPDDGTFEVSELAHGQRTSEGMVVLDDNEREAIGGDDPEKTLELSICPRHELWAATRPGPLAYRLRPPAKAKGIAKAYSVLCAMASHPGYSLYGVAKLSRDKPMTPYTLQTWQGQAILQSLVRPQDLAAPDVIAAWDMTEQNKAMMTEFMKSMSHRFQPDLLADLRADRLQAVVDSHKGEAVPIVTLPNQVSDDDVFAQLEQTLALLKGNVA